MRDALWYLLHFQLPFLQIVKSVPQLLAQADADIWGILLQMVLGFCAKATQSCSSCPG